MTTETETETETAAVLYDPLQTPVTFSRTEWFLLQVLPHEVQIEFVTEPSPEMWAAIKKQLGSYSKAIEEIANSCTSTIRLIQDGVE